MVAAIVGRGIGLVRFAAIPANRSGLGKDRLRKLVARRSKSESISIEKRIDVGGHLDQISAVYENEGVSSSSRPCGG